MPEQKGSYIRALRILAIALMVGVIVFYILAVALRLVDFMDTTLLQDYAVYIVIGLGVVAALFFIGGRNFFNKKIETIKNSSETIGEKLNLYRSALIICYAAFEGIAIFAIILFIVTGNFWFSGIVFLMLLAMISKFPTRQRVIDQLGLDWNEQQEL
ncbi:MAG TPA: hypothetical protein VLJ68_06445 [Chitinophagaceae bacterium]|nr:hypothetical protein [Chitinophagaceae bacterium]